MTTAIQRIKAYLDRHGLSDAPDDAHLSVKELHHFFGTMSYYFGVTRDAALAALETLEALPEKAWCFILDETKDCFDTVAVDQAPIEGGASDEELQEVADTSSVEPTEVDTPVDTAPQSDVLTPAETIPQLTDVAPEPVEAPVVETPAPVDTPVVETPVVDASAPEALAPVDAPAVEAPVETPAPVVETPTEAAPVVDAPADISAPTVETPASN